MQELGLALIFIAGALILATGLPVFVILCVVSVCGALCGLLWGGLSLAIFTALPARLIMLLENDLLQALPLFVLIGLMLDRVPVILTLFKSLRKAAGNKAGSLGATPVLIGALMGPMNGSVGASVLSLSRSLYPRLSKAGFDHATAQGLIAATSTLGVVIPPSLVLILLGDAMMSAHTIALQGSARTDRIINTQDVFHGVLVPAALVLAGFVGVAFWQGMTHAPRQTMTKPEPLAARESLTACTSLLVLTGLLGGVASGLIYAVEAAATGAVLLLAYGFACGALTGETLRAVLKDTAINTGALFALLISATTFTLMLRLLGTDTLISHWLLSIKTGPVLFLCVVLGLIALAALVLDAFEIIFVLIPILGPPLLTRIEDAVWACVCLLLTLQLAFLLPPVGYALMMTRSMVAPTVPVIRLLQAVSPYLLWLVVVLGLVLVWPRSVHWLDAPHAAQRSLAPVPKTAIDTQMRQLLPAPAESLPLPILPTPILPAPVLPTPVLPQR